MWPLNEGEGTFVRMGVGIIAQSIGGNSGVVEGNGALVLILSLFLPNIARIM